jgi:hypothetical protein
MERCTSNENKNAARLPEVKTIDEEEAHERDAISGI